MKWLVGPRACSKRAAFSSCAPVARAVPASSISPAGPTGTSWLHSAASPGPARSRSAPSAFRMPVKPHQRDSLPHIMALDEVTIPPALNLPLSATLPMQPMRTASLMGTAVCGLVTRNVRPPPTRAS
eukprot:2248380-Prymnesium_polylepis.2